MFELLEIKYLSAQIALMIFGMAVIIVWQVVGTVERLHKEQTARTNALWKQLNELIDQKSSQIIETCHMFTTSSSSMTERLSG